MIADATLVAEPEIRFFARRIRAAEGQIYVGNSGLSREQKRSCDRVMTNPPVCADDGCQGGAYSKATCEFVLQSGVGIVVLFQNDPPFVLIDVDHDFAAARKS